MCNETKLHVNKSVPCGYRTKIQLIELFEH